MCTKKTESDCIKELQEKNKNLLCPGRAVRYW